MLRNIFTRQVRQLIAGCGGVNKPMVNAVYESVFRESAVNQRVHTSFGGVFYHEDQLTDNFVQGLEAMRKKGLEHNVLFVYHKPCVAAAEGLVKHPNTFEGQIDSATNTLNILSQRPDFFDSVLKKTLNIKIAVIDEDKGEAAIFEPKVDEQQKIKLEHCQDIKGLSESKATPIASYR
jgi:hypothetical protein